MRLSWVWCLGFLLVSCSSRDSHEQSGAPPGEPATEASIRAELPSLRVIDGSFTGGTATIAYRAYLRPDGEITFVEENNDFGEFGTSKVDFFLRDGYVFSYRMSSEGPAPGDPVQRKTVELTLGFDGPGKLVSSQKLIDGMGAPVDSHESLGALRHLETVRVAVDEKLSTGTGPRAELPGKYTRELRSASTPGRFLTLFLGTDHAARLQSDYMNGEPVIDEEGSWRYFPPARAAVEMRWWKNEAVPPTRFVFELSGDTLRAVEWDRDTYGTDALQLTRVVRFGVLPAEVLGRTWAWASFVSPVEEIQVEEPERYTLQFEEGRVSVRADCNRGSGPYMVSDDYGIRIGPFAVTRAMCSEESLFGRYLGLLESTSSFFTQDGFLYFDLPMDSGTLRFVPQ